MKATSKRGAFENEDYSNRSINMSSAKVREDDPLAATKGELQFNKEKKVSVKISTFGNLSAC